MSKVRCDPEFCCGQWNDWPEKVLCPKCGQIDTVQVWEAWGHPSGDLFCEECTGFYTGNLIEPYWTFCVEDGEAVVVEWERSAA